MPLINLLPSELRKAKTAAQKTTKAASGIPKPTIHIKVDISFLKPVLWVIPVLLAVTGAVYAQAYFKEQKLKHLEEKLGNSKAISKKIAQLKQDIEKNAQAYSFLGRAVNNTKWSEKLERLTQIIPPQIWLSKLTVDSSTIKNSPAAKENRDAPKKSEKIVLEGSATSVIEAEIISAITNFIEKIKASPDFNQTFAVFKMGQLQSVKKGNLTVMNFTITCSSE
ncbi:MAG: PilN domain-containing protein [Candidatus Omnitrophica bacterium]|jgi:hypothetical protein|nr:PilN domain-containing protein [Candidatus Omnitrophota bacterium]